jgi:hypothetical protein
MKKFLLFSVSNFFVGLSSLAQVELINMSISETNAKYLYLSKTNQLYLKNVDASKTYEVKIDENTLEKTDQAQFAYKGPFQEQVKFDIYEDNVLVKSEVFHARRAGDSDITIGNIMSESAKIDEVLESPAFVIHSYDTYIEDEYVRSFTMKIIGENNQVKRSFETVSGHVFTSEQIEMIATLQAGDKIEISELVYTDSEGISRKKPTFAITIL